MRKLQWLSTGASALALGISAMLAAGPSTAANSLVGVHDFSGDTSMVDPAAPHGERGWAVELVHATDACRGDVSGLAAMAQAAKNQGMQVIFRVDYKSANGRQVAVPVNSAEYNQWRSDFFQCTSKLASITNLFIVGNEPNLDYDQQPITAGQYAAAFNHLWAAKPAGVQLLATFNSPFTDPAWMGTMAGALTGSDGFAIHTGGIRGSCTDPRQPCRAIPSWWFDSAFRYYRDVISAIPAAKRKPVYITEFNTYTGGTDPVPQQNYQADWANKAYEEIRNYNATRGTLPEVRALCWFTDRVRTGFPGFALRNIPQALTDIKEEFRNPANRGSTPPTCSTSTLPIPSDRWRLQIWNNRQFSGAPVDVRHEAVGANGFSYNWGNGAASNCTGPDNYAIRFERVANFATSGNYTFTATADDGVRVWVDNVPVIDQWRDQAPSTFTAVHWVAAGNHTIRMDYYENGGGATAALNWTGGGGASNNATVVRSASSVPATMAPNETRQVSVRVTNTGTSTWTAANNYRLGSTSNNTVTWSGWSCGGYNVSPSNARAYLCSNLSIAPGASHTFTFNITAPASGAANFGVRMVRDGVEWFGTTESWSIATGSTNPYPSCPCNRADNYCQHGPSTPGCPMTSPGGYCDPNGNGGYEDGDWTRGYYEYQQYCR
ncbi:PA14 domain-containing protein [Tahibacter amnicola]|uniref:PA14 domain-containing protein n=1 Tax=Tahibacter amnicola TaxID=2976241 RepID=A0ABY6BF36_9GAMM|nr:PA14 domain-containing protein [Tahibacter amnicola]UXI68643.1 PA14 domain-containing protein [Tahibacter amnicola]